MASHPSPSFLLMPTSAPRAVTKTAQNEVVQRVHGPSPGSAGWVRWKPHGVHQLLHQPKPPSNSHCPASPGEKVRREEGEASLAKIKLHGSLNFPPELPLPTVWHLQLTFGWLRDWHSSHSSHQNGAAEVGACPHSLPRPVPPSSQLSLCTSHHLL